MEEANDAPFRVLVIDDERMTGRAVARVLGGFDIEVLAFGSSEEADAWLAVNPLPDAVIEDRRRPEAQGGSHLAALVPTDGVTAHGVRWPRVPKLLHAGLGDLSPEAPCMPDLVEIRFPFDDGDLCDAFAFSLTRFATALETEPLHPYGGSDRFVGSLEQRASAVRFYRGAAARLPVPRER